MATATPTIAAILTSREPHNGTQPAGALTTVFAAATANPYCSTGPYRYQTSICMPPRWNLYSNAASYYSPGICPLGWKSVATVPNGFGPTIEATETAIVCCPTSFAFSANFEVATPYFSCSSYSTYTTTRGLGSYTYISTESRYSYSSSTTVTTTTNTYAYPIQVRFAASDIPNLQTHPLTPGLTPAAAATTTEGSSTSNTSTGTASPGLSTGAAAGIGVGVGLVALGAIAGLIAFFLLRRRKRRTGGAGGNYAAANPGSPATEAEKPPFSSPGTVAGGFASTSTGHGHDHSSPQSQHAGTGYVPEPNMTPAEMAEEYRRVQERRNRLIELERLEQEESRLRSRMALHEQQQRGRGLSEMEGVASPTEVPGKSPAVGAESVYEMSGDGGRAVPGRYA